MILSFLHTKSITPILFPLFLIIYIQSFGQETWRNLPQEVQAEAALSRENYPLAIQLYEEALEIRQAKYPKGIQCSLKAFREIMKAMDHLVSVHGKAGNYPKQIELCEEQLSWAEKAMELYPNKPIPYLEYGLVKIQIAESHQALEQYEKGLDICQNLIDYFLDPTQNRPFKFVAKQIIPYAHSTSGEILKDQGDTKASAIQHENSVAAWQKNLEQVKENVVHEAIARQAKICVQRYDKLKDSTKVMKYADIALKHYKIMTDRVPSKATFIKSVNNVGNTLAIYKAAKGKYEEAIDYYKNSLEINEAQFAQSGDAKDLTQLAAVNLKISQCYASINNIDQAARHLSVRIEQLKQLQDLQSSLDYSYTISRNQYNLAKQYESLEQYALALEVLDQSIALSPISIQRDPESIRKKEWQWVQEFFRYQLLRELEDYDLAYTSLDRLKSIFNTLEALEPEIKYSEHIKEIETSQRELAYPDIVKLDTELEGLEDSKTKFDKYISFLNLLKKKMKKDPSMELSYVKHTSALAWTGLMTGSYKRSLKALKKAMKIKPVDPYLITNYAPCLLFLGKYKKAEKVYTKYYDKPFKPGKKIIDGFLDDFDKFEERGVVPEEHREKMEEVWGNLRGLR